MTIYLFFKTLLNDDAWRYPCLSSDVRYEGRTPGSIIEWVLDGSSTLPIARTKYNLKLLENAMKLYEEWTKFNLYFLYESKTKCNELRYGTCCIGTPINFRRLVTGSEEHIWHERAIFGTSLAFALPEIARQFLNIFTKNQMPMTNKFVH